MKRQVSASRSPRVGPASPGAGAEPALTVAAAMDKLLNDSVPHGLASDVVAHALNCAVLGVAPSTPPTTLPSLKDVIAVAGGDSGGAGGVCGYVFKTGDIGYNCRNCEADPTCVLCQACFKASSHQGHDVRFHRVSAGGCCDCGDTEAWAEDGMCPKHRPGNADASETARLEQPLQAQFEHGVAAVVARCVSTVVNMVQTCQAPDGASAVAGLSDEYVVVLRNDDVHTYDEVINALVEIGQTRVAAQAMATQVDKSGQAHAFKGRWSDANHAARRLASHGLFLSLEHVSVAAARSVLGPAFEWLTSVSEASAATAQIVANALTARLPLPYVEHHRLIVAEADSKEGAAERNPKWETPVALFVRADAYLDPASSEAVHTLYMVVLKSSKFRQALAEVFGASYLPRMAEFSRGIGTAQHNIDDIGVQLLTSPSTVASLVESVHLFTAITASLAAMFVHCLPDVPCPTVNVTDRTVIQHRYTAPIRDLQFVNRLPGFAEKLLADRAACKALLLALSRCQRLDPRVRERGAHVLYESRSWQEATQLGHVLGDMISEMGQSVALGDADTEAVGAHWRAPLDSILTAIMDWLQLAKGISSEWVVAEHASAWLGSARIVHFNLLGSGSVSLHYPLHRLLGTLAWYLTCGRNLDVPSVLQLKDRSLEQELALLEYPLRVVATAAHVRAGLWRRNGQSTAIEIGYYSTAGAKVMYLQDLRALQLACSSLPPATVLLSFVNRFGVASWLQQDDGALEEGAALTADMLQTIIHMLTELPQDFTALDGVACNYSSLDAAQECVYNIVKRAVVHILLVKNHPHSAVVEFVNTCYHRTHVSLVAVVDKVLQDVAVRKAARGNEPPMYELKREHYGEYDPAFLFLKQALHGAARDRWLAWRKETPAHAAHGRAMCPPMPDAHPTMLAVRSLLHAPQLVRLLHAILWHADTPRVTDALTERALHVLCLSVHSWDYEVNPELLAGFAEALTSPFLAPGVATSSTPLSMIALLDRLRSSPSPVAKDTVNWLLHQLRHRLRGLPGAQVVEALFARDVAAAGGAEGPTKSKKQPKDARARALEKMKAQASKFAAQIDDAAVSGGNADDAAADPSEAATEAEEHSATCIVCHEVTTDPLVHLGFAQLSAMWRLLWGQSTGSATQPGKRRRSSRSESGLTSSTVSPGSPSPAVPPPPPPPAAAGGAASGGAVGGPGASAGRPFALDEDSHEGDDHESIDIEHTDNEDDADGDDDNGGTGFMVGEEEDEEEDEEDDEDDEEGEPLALHSMDDLRRILAQVGLMGGPGFDLADDEDDDDDEDEDFPDAEVFTGVAPSGERQGTFRLPFDRVIAATSGEGLHLRFCGHVMHSTCGDAFIMNLRAKAEAQMAHPGAHALDPSDFEFVCPLCKALTNVMVPLAAPVAGATTVSVSDVRGRLLSGLLSGGDTASTLSATSKGAAADVETSTARLNEARLSMFNRMFHSYRPDRDSNEWIRLLLAALGSVSYTIVCHDLASRPSPYPGFGPSADAKVDEDDVQLLGGGRASSELKRFCSIASAVLAACRRLVTEKDSRGLLRTAVLALILDGSVEIGSNSGQLPADVALYLAGPSSDRVSLMMCDFVRLVCLLVTMFDIGHVSAVASMLLGVAAVREQLLGFAQDGPESNQADATAAATRSSWSSVLAQCLGAAGVTDAHAVDALIVRLASSSSFVSQQSWTAARLAPMVRQIFLVMCCEAGAHDVAHGLADTDVLNAVTTVMAQMPSSEAWIRAAVTATRAACARMTVLPSGRLWAQDVPVTKVTHIRYVGE